MAVIYLRHDKHGAKVATSEAEAAYDAKQGWTRFDPSASVGPASDPVSTNTIVLDLGKNPELAGVPTNAMPKPRRKAPAAA